MDSQNQNPIAGAGAMPDPAPAPTPAPAPAPTFVSGPTPTPAAAPINPMGGQPKKSKAPMIIAIILVLALAIGGAVAAILIMNGNKSSSETKTDKDTSKTDNKDDKDDKDKKDPEPTKTSGDTISFAFDGYEFEVGETFGETVRSAAKAGKIYKDTDDWKYEEITDVDEYLSGTYKFRAEDESGELPDVYLFKDPDNHYAGYTQINSSYFSMNSKDDGVRKYSELEANVYAWCDEGLEGSVSDFEFECYKTTPDDVKNAFSKAEKTFEDYENLEVEEGNFTIYFEFDRDENTLDAVRVDYYKRF
jgi:hypothetical protein